MDCSTILAHRQREELAIVGAVLYSPHSHPSAVAALDNVALIDPLCAATITCIGELLAAGHDVDGGSVAHALVVATGRPRHEVVHFLTTVAEVNGTASTIPRHAQAIHEAAAALELRDLGKELRDITPREVASTAAHYMDRLRTIGRRVAVDAGGASLAAAWRKSLKDYTKPTRYQLAAPGSQFNRIEIGPELVTIFGAPPGGGKTALVNQLVFDALAHDPNLRALIANVEMTPIALLDRQLSRLSGVPYSKIRERTWLASDEIDIVEAADEIEAILARLTIMPPPFTIERVRALADANDANVVVVDYLQRFELARPAPDLRQHVSAVMSACRAIAMEGRAVVAISAISRQSYSGVGDGLGAFRESSEIEFGADAAYLLNSGEETNLPAREITLQCVKNRHGARTPIELTFHGAYQRFTAPKEPEETGPAPYPEFEGAWSE